MKKGLPVIIIVLVVVAILCCCLIVILGAAYYSFSKVQKALPTLAASLPILPGGATPTPFQIIRQPPDQIPLETLKLLEQIVVPENDLNALACRFKSICGPSGTPLPPAQPFPEGTQASFWVYDEDTNSNFQVQSTLRYATPHSYFWVADGVHYNLSDVKSLMDAFESQIYPTDREFFGSEWTPGVDDDPHIYILYTHGLGGTVAGYFSSLDEYPQQVFQYSNAHEMFYISSSESLTNLYTFGDLAHEFQHMIHWYQDRNETAFLNEGFSELATFLNHYDNGFFDRIYLANPDLNLTDWLGSSSDNSAHYGASFLFVTYFLDRFGEDLTKSLIHNPQNGLDSLDNTLAQAGITDPATGKTISADDFFLDWAITNIVNDASVADGRYVYHNYAAASTARPTETVASCPVDTSTRTVNQYGVDYIHLTCPGNYTLNFAGATSTHLLPADPHSGAYAYWSNKGDESDMALTHIFDLSSVSGTVNMSYWTWYDIEKDFDYVYVEASTDGQHWTILNTPSGTTSNPNDTSYGWGYTGKSSDWIQESVDLSQYAGQKVSVRFEYITDQAVNGEGFLLDDVNVPSINYSTDFEKADSSWVAAGFARIQNAVPQTYHLALVSHTSGGTSVQIIPISAEQSADIPISVGQNGVQDQILVVTATTRFTRVIAPYQFTIH
jgi:immune inhibitor A